VTLEQSKIRISNTKPLHKAPEPVASSNRLPAILGSVGTQFTDSVVQKISINQGVA